MKQFIFTLFIFSTGCQNSRPKVITADSLRIFTLQSQSQLDNDIKELNEVYKQQIEIAEHSNDDSIQFYEGKLGLAQAGGQNPYVLFAIEKQINKLKLDAAQKGLAIVSKQAKRQMDMVYSSKFNEKKERDLYEIQQKLDRNEISKDQYADQVSKVKSSAYVSTVTEENALKLSMDYDKEKISESLNAQQKLLEAKIDSESKK